MPMNNQFRHLYSQVWFALLDEKLPKLGCEGWERVGEEQSYFGLPAHGNLSGLLEQLRSN
jgi:hypothetical protein